MSTSLTRSAEDSDDEIQQSTKRVKSGQASRKKAPNILVSGTPGVGKTTLCQKLKDLYAGDGHLIEVINIGELAKEHGLLGEFDEAYQCPELDEDGVVDHLEPKMSDAESVTTVVIDHHGTDFFPERWFDAVFVLRTNNSLLYDRLQVRGYSGKKLEDNIQCEIFQTILDEARESYRPEIVHELCNESQQELESNINRIIGWIKQWKEDNC